MSNRLSSLVGLAAGAAVALAISANISNQTALTLAGALSLVLLGWGAVWLWRRARVGR